MFGSDGWVRKKRELREQKSFRWGEVLRGRGRADTPPPVRRALSVSQCEPRAFGDPPEMNRSNSQRRSKAQLLSDLGTLRKVDIIRRETVNEEQLNVLGNPNRTLENNFKPTIGVRSKLFENHEIHDIPRSRHSIMNDKSTLPKFNELRSVDFNRKEDARSRIVHLHDPVKDRESRWISSPTPIDRFPDPLELSDLHGRRKGAVRAKVFDWQVDQQQRLIREKEAKAAKLMEMQPRSPSIVRRGSAAGASPHTPRKQKIPPKVEDELRKLQEENTTLRKTVEQVQMRSPSADRVAHRFTERSQPHSSLEPTPIDMLEYVWIPRRQIEEWQQLFTGNSFYNKVVNSSVRYVGTQGTYKVGIITDILNEKYLVIDTSHEIELVQVQNVSNSCFSQSEVQDDLLRHASTSHASPERQPIPKEENVFAHSFAVDSTV